MLVVKVEIWPGGSADRAFEVSRLGIANVSGMSDISDYELTALLSRDRDEFVMRSKIVGHQRTQGWVPLVRRSMTNVFLGERAMDEVPYDDPVAELLRKGGHD